MPTSPIFQKPCIAHSLKRAMENYEDHNFILQWVAREIQERLADIKRDYKHVLILSSRQSDDLVRLFPGADVTILDMVCDPEDLPDVIGYDLILSNCDLHKINDLPGMLARIRRALKPDGVFLACFPGGETLHELRASLLHAEIATLGGASPRVFPFVDKQQAGALLQRAGFALPVVDSDILDVSYRDMFQLMADLRGMGETNSLAGRHKYFTPSRLFAEAAQYYAANYTGPDGRLKASFEMIFMIGWAPHDSQQKPAKRGSGKVPLTEVLK